MKTYFVGHLRREEQLSKDDFIFCSYFVLCYCCFQFQYRFKLFLMALSVFICFYFYVMHCPEHRAVYTSFKFGSKQCWPFKTILPSIVGSCTEDVTNTMNSVNEDFIRNPGFNSDLSQGCQIPKYQGEVLKFPEEKEAKQQLYTCMVKKN